ncbi:hypothetical protein GGS20DRAFT_536638 [Poronia punctata]|nr:hypothetical protein GGS20DRAFT_536638 [Poronia punctata]
MASLTLARAATALSRVACRNKATTTTTIRTFSSLPTLRPTILNRTPNFRPSNIQLSRLPTTTTTTSEGITVDIIPKSSITSNPALAGPQQIRCGPRPTMARTSRLVRKRRHGFLSRIRTRNGQKTLQRRREKKRSVMSM